MDILTSISLVIYPVEWSYRVSHIEIEFSNLLLRIEGPILFFDLWCLAASGGADICVSSTSFQKNFEATKGQIISKHFFLAKDSSKKRTKTRRILVKMNSFVRFLEESSA